MDPVIVEISSDEEEEGDLFADYVFGVGDLGRNDFDGVVVVGENKSQVPMIEKVSSGGRVDSDDDCLILDKDPESRFNIVDDNTTDNGADDLVIVGEKGQLACRDFPHPRHLCAKFPFATTSHDEHCDQCHCYVCDLRAPCNHWGTGVSSIDHCHATDKEEVWRQRRKLLKQGLQVNFAAASCQSIPNTTAPSHVPHQIPGRLQLFGSVSKGLSRQLHGCSIAFGLPNIISHSQNQIPCLRPMPARVNRCPVVQNRLQQLRRRPAVVNRERGYAGTVGLQPVVSHPKFKRMAALRSYCPKGIQSGYGSHISNPSLTYVPTQLTYVPMQPTHVPTQPMIQSPRVVQRDINQSILEALLSDIDSPVLNTFDDNSHKYGTSGFPNSLSYLETQAYNQLPQSTSNQNMNQSMLLTTCSNNPSYLGNSGSCSNASNSESCSDAILSDISNDIPQYAPQCTPQYMPTSGSDSAFPSSLSSGPSTISQSLSTSTKDLLPVDHLDVSDLSTDLLLSDFDLMLPELTSMDPASILLDL